MDYEQKYKEALKAMESLYNVVKYQSSSDALLTSQTIEKAFPELRESEDEKMIKSIKEAVEYYWSDDTQAKNDIIAWLEKQGQEKSIDMSVKEKAYQIAWEYSKHYDPLLSKESWCMLAALDMASWLAKKDEKKSTYKVEPKFHKGDWITNGDYLWQITNIDILDYTVKSQNGDVVEDDIAYVDNEFHIWTIQDAKDGDVLADDRPFIFRDFGDKKHSKDLLESARKELEKEDWRKPLRLYKNGYENGIRDALKSLPKWKRDYYHNINSVFNGILYYNGYYIDINELEKLPKEE